MIFFSFSLIQLKLKFWKVCALKQIGHWAKIASFPLPLTIMNGFPTKYIEASHRLYLGNSQPYYHHEG